MKKNKSKCTVLMVGPAESVKGGIRTVVDQYLFHENWKDIDLLYIPTYLEGGALKKATYFAMQMFKIIFVCITKRVDILHLHVSERGSFWRKAMVLKMFSFFGGKTVLHHHGAEFFSFFDNATLGVKRYIMRTIERTDVNLVLSKYHLGMMQERFSKGKFEVLYNAITPLEEITYDPEASGILFVGRLGQRKGTYDLIEALAEVDDRLSAEVKVYFCGDGEVERTVRTLREKNLMHRVAHAGWCDKIQLQRFYRQSMLFILPSHHEGVPMSLLEAMCAGIPCITTNIDGMPEVVSSGINGLLIEPGNLEQMKACILQLAQNRELRKEIGKKGSIMVKNHFLLDNHIDTLFMIYENLVLHKKRDTINE